MYANTSKHTACSNVTSYSLTLTACAYMRHCTTACSLLWCEQGRSFVCDVNGWSFVKNSRKYHEDCALLLMEFFEAAVKPSRKVTLVRIYAVSLYT
jgi:hypothetical protein